MSGNITFNSWAKLSQTNYSLKLDGVFQQDANQSPEQQLQFISPCGLTAWYVLVVQIIVRHKVTIG